MWGSGADSALNEKGALQGTPHNAVLQVCAVQKLHDNELPPLVPPISWMLQMAGWFRADAASCLPPKAFQSLWILGYVLG